MHHNLRRQERRSGIGSAASPRQLAAGPCAGDAESRRAGIEREQLAENPLVRDVRGPTVRRRHGSVRDRVRVREPLRPNVVGGSSSVRFLRTFAASSSGRAGRYG